MPPVIGARWSVSLTVDAEHPDGPHHDEAAPWQLLEALEQLRVRATFFCQGRWVMAHPKIATAIARAGHTIGNHSYYHAELESLTEAGLRDDTLKAEEVIRSMIGVDPKPWYRSPFGSGRNDARVPPILAELGYRYIGWDSAGYDWEDTRSADDVANIAIEQALAHGDHAVIVLHTWPRSVPPSLARIVRELRDRGAEFVDLSAMPIRTSWAHPGA